MKLTKSAGDVELQHELALQLPNGHWIGHYYLGYCPIHDNHNTPAFFLYPDGYRCLGCGAWGSLNRLKSVLSGIPIRYSEGRELEINEKPLWSTWLKEYGSYEGIAQHAYQTGKEYPVLLRYLVERKVECIIEQSYVGYIDGWLTFPVFNKQGKMVDIVVRATPSVETKSKYVVRPRKNSNEGFILYANDWVRIMNSKELYVPFGILDMNVLSFLGYPSATGMTGHSYKPSWFDGIRKRIYIIPDRGEEKSAHELQQLLGWRARVLELDYPDNTKDPTDIYVGLGSKILIELIEEKK